MGFSYLQINIFTLNLHYTFNKNVGSCLSDSTLQK